MKKRIFVIFTFLFTVYYILLIPYTAYAVTYNQFMEMTSSGVTRINNAARTIAAGIFTSRAILGLAGLPAGIAVAAIAIDLVNRFRDNVQVRVPAGSTFIGSSNTLESVIAHYSNPIGIWGNRGTSAFPVSVRRYQGFYTRSYPYCDFSYSLYSTSSYPVPAGFLAVGGLTNIVHKTVACDPVHGRVPSRVVVHQVRQYVFAVPIPSPSATYSPQPIASPVPQSDIHNRAAAIHIITQAIEWLNTQSASAATSVSQVHPTTAVNSHEILLRALRYLQEGIPVVQGVDYVAVVPIPDTARDVPIAPPLAPPLTDAPPTPTPPPITDGVCAPCVRTKKFDDIFQNVSSQASGIGVLMLLDRLVMSPSGGQLPTTLSFSVAPFGAVHHDLNTWNFWALIAALRFFVLAGAFIAAYYIIFS